MEHPVFIRRSFLSAVGVTAYTTAIGWLLFNAHRLFGERPDTALAPISVLTLLVLSVGIVGTIIFLRPVLMYLDGKKTDAVKLLVATLAWLALFTVILFVVQFVL